MRNSLGKLCVILATILILFSVGFFTVSLILRDNNYIEEKYRELEVSETMGIATPDLSAATTALLDYMRGERVNIRFAARVNGVQTDDIFSQEKEVVHMAEVQVLWFTLSAIARYGLLAAVILLILGFVLIERGSRRILFARGIVWGSGIFGGLLALMGVWAVLNFSSFWTVFHFILFPASLFQYLAAGATPEAMNELNWVLSSDSIMVNMLMPIFPALVLRCAVFIAAEIAAVLLFGLLLRYAGRKKLTPAVADIVTVDRDVNEPVPIDGPDLILAHRLRNAPVSKREEIKREAEAEADRTEPAPEAEAPSPDGIDSEIRIADRTEAPEEVSAAPEERPDEQNAPAEDADETNAPDAVSEDTDEANAPAPAIEEPDEEPKEGDEHAI